MLAQQGTCLDPDQKAAVYADVNCIVSAGAGSGKTTVLSYRFLRLVLEAKATASEILTLTFTRKAAREMHQRIHRLLLSCKDDPVIAAQLAQFDQAPISTLDSFCSSIVRSSSVSYGIAQDFAIDDEQNLANARQCAMRLLDDENRSEGAKLVSTLYSPEDLIDSVLVPLLTQHYYLPQKVDEDAQTIIIEAVVSRYEQLKVSFAALLQRYSLLGDSSKTVQGVREDAVMLLAGIASSSDEQELFALLSSPVGFRSIRGGKSEDLLFIKDTYASYLEMRRLLCLALAVLNGREQLQSIVTFVQQLVEEYQKEKRKSGMLTFSDVSSLAVEILKQNKALRKYFKQRFRYIMIDEFQDNNEQQKELLYLLAERLESEGEGIPKASELEPDKLFFVGDEKQSIYRFRGSDVRVFKRLSGELASVGGKSIELATNYRSEPALIEWFNTLFPSIMENNGEAYEASFSSLKTRKASEGITSTATILIKPYENGERDEEEEEEEAKDSDAEAYCVACLIKKMLTCDDYLVPSPDGPRRPKASDVALLLRSTSNQLSFERAFRHQMIPYTVQSARSLMLEALASDFYAMLQLALYPEDRHAYATVLRSPFCKISDAGLALVLDQQQLFSPPMGLEGEDELRLLSTQQFYRSLLQAMASESLSQLVFRLWYESGYYLSLTAHPEYQAYREHYTFFHRLAQKHEQAKHSVSQFVDYLRQNLAQNEKLDDLEVINEVEEGVQIMSIHKSKGLEFPIVIVANASSKGRGRKEKLSTFKGVALPHYLNQRFFVTATKTEVARHAGALFDEGEEQRLELAELKRLLYVALTRAETHLVVSGTFGKNNRALGEGKPADTLLLLMTRSLGLDISKAEFQEGLLTVGRIASISEGSLYQGEGESEQAFLKRLAAVQWWYETASPALEQKPIRYAVTSLVSHEEHSVAADLPLFASDELLMSLEQDLTAAFGTFVHALCEQMVLKQDLGDVRTCMPSELVKALGERELSIIAEDGLALAAAFIKSAWYQSEVEPYPVASEVGFFSTTEHEGRNVVVEGSIDLLVDRPDHLLVIDFKTDRRRDAEVHRFQVETYMRAVKRIYQRPVKGCIVYLRDVETIEVWEGVDDDADTL
jgi:ATP-dependent exoDNAse (exonuclease V) beta subunit